MKKIIALVLSFALVACMLCGCGNQSNNQQDRPSVTVAAEPAEAKDYTLVDDTTGLKIQVDAPIELIFACNATITPGTSTMGDALLKYFDEVKTWTDGQVVIDMFDGGQLGADLEMVSSNQSGVVDIYWSNPANLTGIIPELAVFDISGLYDSPVQCNYVIKNGFMDLIQPYCNKANVQMISMFSPVARQLSSNKPVNSLADLQGQKIRVQENIYHQAFWNALGCNAVPLSMSDLYISLQQNMIDGCENPWGSIMANKIYEVQQYYVQTDAMMFVHTFTMNLAKYNSLTSQQKHALEQCFYSIELYNMEHAAADDDVIKENLISLYDKTVSDCPQDIKAAYATATQAVVDLMKEKLDPAYVDSYIDTVNAAKASMG